MQPGAGNASGRVARDQPWKPVCQLSGLSPQGAWIPLTGSTLGVRAVNPLPAKAGWQAARRAAPLCRSEAESHIWTRAGMHTPQLLQTKSGQGSFHHLRLPGVHEPHLNFHLELEEEQAPADEPEGPGGGVVGWGAVGCTLAGLGLGSSGPCPGGLGLAAPRMGWRWGVRPRKHAQAPEGTAARTALTQGGALRGDLLSAHGELRVPGNHSPLSQLVTSTANSLHRLWFPWRAEDRTREQRSVSRAPGCRPGLRPEQTRGRWLHLTPRPGTRPSRAPTARGAFIVM